MPQRLAAEWWEREFDRWLAPFWAALGDRGDDAEAQRLVGGPGGCGAGTGARS